MNNSRKIYGFEPSIFVKPVNLDFICIICSRVVRNPRECIICGGLSCENCLKQWQEKNKDDKSKINLNFFQTIVNAK